MRKAAENALAAQSGRPLPHNPAAHHGLGPDVPNAGDAGSKNIPPLMRFSVYRSAPAGCDRQCARDWLLAEATGQTRGDFGLFGNESPFSPTYFGGDVAGFVAARTTAHERGDRELEDACTLLVEQTRTLIAAFTRTGVKLPKGHGCKPDVWTLAPGPRSYDEETALRSDLTTATAALLLGLSHKASANPDNTRMLAYRLMATALEAYPLPVAPLLGVVAQGPQVRRGELLPVVIERLAAVKVRAPLHYVLTTAGYSAWISSSSTGNGAPCYAVTVPNDGAPEVLVLHKVKREGAKGGHLPGHCEVVDGRIVASGGWGPKERRTASIPLVGGTRLAGFVVDMDGARILTTAQAH